MALNSVLKAFLSIINRSPLLVYAIFAILWWRINWLYSSPEMSSGMAAANALVLISLFVSFTYYLLNSDPRTTFEIDVGPIEVKTHSEAEE